MFLDTKWWMLGSTVVTEPRALAWHLSAGRTYSYLETDYVYNLFHVALILGADAWAEKAYLHYAGKLPREVLDSLRDQAARDAEDHQRFVRERSQMSFEDLARHRPREGLNEIRIGERNLDPTRLVSSASVNTAKFFGGVGQKPHGQRKAADSGNE